MAEITECTVLSRFQVVLEGQAVSFRIQRLQPSSQYTLRIASSSESGMGVWSDHVTYETLPLAPPTPAELALRQDDDLITVSWKPVDYHLPVTYDLQQAVVGGDFSQVRP